MNNRNATDSSMPFPEFRILDGNAYAVLRRAFPEDRTQPCPYCGLRHAHGPTDGHRIAHCPDTAREEITLPAVTLRRRDGYLVITDHR